MHMLHHNYNINFVKVVLVIELITILTIFILLGKQYLYHILATQDCVEMWFIKIILLGAPGIGKTTVRRRLTGEIKDISSSGERVHHSTGAVDSKHGVLSSTTAMVTPTQWLATKDLTGEARMFFQYIYSNIAERTALQSEADEESTISQYEKHLKQGSTIC